MIVTCHCYVHRCLFFFAVGGGILSDVYRLHMSAAPSFSKAHSRTRLIGLLRSIEPRIPKHEASRAKQ